MFEQLPADASAVAVMPVGERAGDAAGEAFSLDDPLFWGGIREAAEAWSMAAVLDTLEAMPPDDEVARMLRQVDPTDLSYREQVRVLRLWERHVRWSTAQQQTWVLAIAGPVAGTGPVAQLDEVAVEIEVGGVLALTDRAAAERIRVARALHRRFAATASALARGDLTVEHALVLARETRHLDDDAAALVERVALRPAHRRKTVGEFRGVVRRAAATADPATTAQRAARARAGRHVWFRPLDDGMAEIGAVLPAAAAMGAYRALDALAHGARRRDPGDARTLDMHRADAFADALAGVLADPALPRAHRRPVTVGVTLDAATLFGLAEHPGHLDGYGPIDAETARELAADSTWRLMLLDAVSGRLTHLGTRSYTPTARLAEFITARDRTCRVPRCTRPAFRCDLDHRVPYDHRHPDRGGQTDEDNLQALCEHHHQARHGGCITVRAVGADALEWTTKAGFTYLDETPDLGPIRFEPPESTAPPGGTPPPDSTAPPGGTAPPDSTAPPDFAARAGGTAPPEDDDPPCPF
jgi:hypothetical protein